MRIVVFSSGEKLCLGQPIDETTALRIDGALAFGPLTVTDEKLRIEKLYAPVMLPQDILCIGLNYRDHAAESRNEIPKHPLLFIKARSSLNRPFGPIRIPRLSNQVDYEGELAVVIGKSAKDVSPQHALEYVLGYTIANDVTARDWQRDKNLGGGQFARGKSFDGFCPIGPCLVTADEIPDPNALRIKTTLNGQVMQDASTADMIFNVPELIASLSSTMTLGPRTVILTGTPAGVGMGRNPPVWLKPGDRIAVEIEKIGRLENEVVNESDALSP